MLSRLMCLTIGCEVVFKQDGNHVYGVCIRCGRETPGWTYGEPVKDEGTTPYWEAIHQEMMDVELALHGGG